MSYPQKQLLLQRTKMPPPGLFSLKDTQSYYKIDKFCKDSSEVITSLPKKPKSQQKQPSSSES